MILATPGPSDSSIHHLASGVQQVVLGCPDDNPLGRVRTFRRKLENLLREQVFNIIHFRSIFEGIVAIDNELNRGAKLVYEANGFPSIEMKYHYPALLENDELVRKLRRQEDRCLRAADRIITVSQTNRAHIESRIEPAFATAVIPNGADLEPFAYQSPSPLNTDLLRLIYVGTTSPWQGINVLLESVEMIQKSQEVQLLIVGAATGRRTKQVQQQIAKLGIEPQVKFQEASTKSEVCQLFHESHLTVVPLLKLDRNTIQGCCPIKLIEAMASGCPVIASNLPVVQEIATPDIHFLPARPGDGRNLKNLILQLADDNELQHRLSLAARQHVEQNLTWELANQKLLKVYQAL